MVWLQRWITATSTLGVQGFWMTRESLGFTWRLQVELKITRTFFRVGCATLALQRT
jgi:hypothetical protein